jgi:(2R)-ethylmalonyl-CoA mutase
MQALFDGIPIQNMNTSMTINAPAAWILALFLNEAKKQNARVEDLRGTIQNDIVKEYLSRGTYIFPPKPSMDLTAQVVSFSINKIPKWNPINICSYHLQEVGATPVQEIAYTLANAIGVLDHIKNSGKVDKSKFPLVVGRISFFLNAGIRFIEEVCKIRVFSKLWNRTCRERYRISDEKLCRFRYGAQVNSLNLVKDQPENNVPRIVYELLGIVLSKNTRARSVQLPAWNEALGLPRKWDQQWSLRIQQILAYETDILEYGDIFEGSVEILRKEKELEEEANAEIEKILDMGGILAALENGELKRALVKSNAVRLNAIENGTQTVVGLNKFIKTEKSLLMSETEEIFINVDEAVEGQQIEELRSFKISRDNKKIAKALSNLKKIATQEKSIIESTIECAQCGVTTGEWADTLREVYGEYRAPTGISIGGTVYKSSKSIKDIRMKVQRIRQEIGRNAKIMIGKPGLDGHSNGAEQLALCARDCGMDVVYEGIRLSPEQIAECALQEGVHLVALSMLSGAHRQLVPEIMKCMKERNIDHKPIVIGGLIPEKDEPFLKEKGVEYINSDKQLKSLEIVERLVCIIDERKGLD